MLIARADSVPLVTEPIGVLAILLGVLAVIFWLTEHKTFGRVFKVVPALVFCYFVPTTLTTLGVLPESSPLYSWIKAFVLPASLLLLILALDVPGIIRLGPKAGIMLLAGTVVHLAEFLGVAGRRVARHDGSGGQLDRRGGELRRSG